MGSGSEMWTTKGWWLVALCVACTFADVTELGDRLVTGLEVSASDRVDHEERGQFEEYITRHSKAYADHEREHRFQNFRESLHFVHKFNSDKKSKFKVGMNEFADMNQDEFASKFLVNEGLEQEEPKGSTENQLLSQRAATLSQMTEGRIGESADAFEGMEMGTLHENSGKELPRAVDWSDSAGRVYKQGICAACYTFTTNSAIKAQYEKKTGRTMPELSDQEILSCSRSAGNHGCVGGNMEKSYHYILGKHPRGELSLAKDYPYEGDEGTCKADRFKTTATHLKGYRKVHRGSETDLQDALSQHPVAVGIDAHHPAFKLYESGTFDIDYCTTKLTHAVLLTGYGVDESGQKYYKLKNSWGDQWGNKGFGHIKRGNNMCAIANLASYPIVDASKTNY